MAQLEFFHDYKFKKPFNLFEALHVRDAEVDTEEFKIRLPNKRVRKFNLVGQAGSTLYGAFKVNKVEYYFKLDQDEK
jgi:hypothetical protein